MNELRSMTSLLNWNTRSARCAKSSGMLLRTYHSKSYQSRPFTRFFHARYTNACIFPANKSGRVKQRVMNEWGSRSSFCSVVNFKGGCVSTSIFIGFAVLSISFLSPVYKLLCVFYFLYQLFG